MRVLEIRSERLARLSYLNAGRRGRTEVSSLDVEHAIVDELPARLDAMIVASDLQGIVPNRRTGESELLGIAVARWLEELADTDIVPLCQRTAVLLAGDLYSVPAANKRGGFGCVASVWDAFAERFAWVAGVPGNHDDVSRVSTGSDVYLLDGQSTTVMGLRLGGVGRICGDPDKPGRRERNHQLAAIEGVAAQGLDVLLLHEGPDGGDRQPGNDEIRAVLERAPVGLIVCGHVRWPAPLAQCGPRQVMNVEGRVVLLTRG